MRVAAVIPSLNTKELTTRCVASLLEQELEASLEVVVVDMYSSDLTAQHLAEVHPEVRVLQRDNRGYGAAANAGARSVDCDWLLVCNSDVRFPDRKTLSTLLRVAGTCPKVGVFGARLVSVDGTPQRSARRLPGRLALAWILLP